MGWDGSGYRVTQDDLDLIKRIGMGAGQGWVVKAFAARQRFMLDWESSNGLIEGRVGWDDLPPADFGRMRRVSGGRSYIHPVTPEASARLGAVPEAVWSAVEGGRAVLTSRLAEQTTALLESTQGTPVTGRRIGELRGRVVQHGLLEHALLVGDDDPLVLRECLMTDCIIRDCTFQHVVFVDCDFTRTTFERSLFVNCEVVNCIFDDSRWGAWATHEVTLRGLGDDGPSTESRKGTRIDWSAANTAHQVRVRGDGVSIRGAVGIGPALFMPPSLADLIATHTETMRTAARSFGSKLARLNSKPDSTPTTALRRLRTLFNRGLSCCRAASWRAGKSLPAVVGPDGNDLTNPWNADPVALLARLQDEKRPDAMELSYAAK